MFRCCHPLALADLIWAVFVGLVLFEENKRLFDPRKDFLRSILGLAIELMARGLAPGQAGEACAAAVKVEGAAGGGRFFFGGG